MTAPSTHKLLACLSRLGSYTAIGSVTGKRHTITSSGTWVEIEDADAIMETKIEVYCARSNERSFVCPVHLVQPTQDQIRQLMFGKEI